MRADRGYKALLLSSTVAFAGVAMTVALVWMATGSGTSTRSEAALRGAPMLPSPGFALSTDDDWPAKGGRLSFIPPSFLPPPVSTDATHQFRPSVTHNTLDNPGGVARNEPEQPSDAAPVTLGSWATAVQPEARQRRPILQGPTTAREKRRQNHTLKTRLAEISPAAEPRLVAKFKSAGAVWPPDEIALVAIKDQKVLELHGRSGTTGWTFIHRYPVLAASGGPGPKLLEGDKQVPEGVYRIVFLNPRSAFHVSLRVNYPNAFDKRMAREDGRKRLGGDIMIHGKQSSAGCLAMGDDAAEELFVLAAITGTTKVKLIIAPTDFRMKNPIAVKDGQPAWLPKLYTEVAAAMEPFKAPREKSLLSFFMQ